MVITVERPLTVAVARRGRDRVLHEVRPALPQRRRDRGTDRPGRTRLRRPSNRSSAGTGRCEVTGVPAAARRDDDHHFVGQPQHRMGDRLYAPNPIVAFLAREGRDDRLLAEHVDDEGADMAATCHPNSGHPGSNSRSWEMHGGV